ncbi:hypothetical protein LTR56_014910 [Elasticomyces elasticus]|nr:hypothetical protein LTR56_014910 [Elasticomyces elasticus]KAK3653273.1 hypothetical protein LTR22_011233 [Elasticomyces elasticus]KAK4918282.1 hypothetical protein LTR49_013981 [Elasticomyces elasticus]KAK5758332.1 hypothetical protein LTS12_011505 [Elasticomyces elasticus]
MATQTETELVVLSSAAGPALYDPSAILNGSLRTPTLAGNDHVEPTQAYTAARTLPKGRSIIVITQLSCINLVSSFTNGLLTVALPAMAADLSLKPNLLVWPASVYYLTSGACLLTAGAVADVLGPRIINLIGCFLLACFMLASGLSRTGIELIMFRAMQGIASALVMPSAMSILSTSLEDGKPRNIGFACAGMSQPLGFSFGLVFGGVLIQTVGWRVGFYVASALAFALFVIGIWALPKVDVAETQTPKIKRLATEIDWVGAGIASGSISIFSYVLAVMSGDVDSIGKASNIVLLCLSIALVPTFIIWVKVQEKRGKPALIPNKIWKNMAFSCVCVMVLLANAVANCMELFSSLFFQEVQGTTALGASLRMLPNLLMGAFINVITGILVDKIPATYAVLGASSLNIGAPLLMALINPHWPYWYDAFFAQILSPVSADVLFTVGLLIVSASFPAHTQGLAGAIFNTVTQLGASIGLTLLSVISTSVTEDSGITDKGSPKALFEGYKAAFWALVGMTTAAVIVGGIGLRKLGKVGEKRD